MDIVKRLIQAIKDYENCTENEERSDVVAGLIDDLNFKI